MEEIEESPTKVREEITEKINPHWFKKGALK